MTAFTTTANLVEQSALDEESLLTATLGRGDVEALLAEGHPQLWFEVGTEGEADPYRLTVELTEEDLRALLAGSSSDEIVLALDGEEIATLLEEPDVEAHGLRAALAVSIAVATTAVAAPAAIAATPQAANPATVRAATSQQSVRAATSQQAVGAAATTQVSRQIVRSQLRPGARSQKLSPLKLRSLSILRAGVVR